MKTSEITKNPQTKTVRLLPGYEDMYRSDPGFIPVEQYMDGETQPGEIGAVRLPWGYLRLIA